MPLSPDIIATSTNLSFSTNGRSRVSHMADGLVGSEILKIAADIRALTAAGASVCNLTVGDFNPAYFPIPDVLRDGIVKALGAGETNYPPSDGILSLRTAVQQFYDRALDLRYPIESIVICSGARPAIFGTYGTLIDPGDRVIYPVPSWNNNHYCHVMGARAVPVVCNSDNAFLPTREELAPVVRGARLLALCSPLNPTGTAFSRDALEGICDLVLEENARRASERPLFVMYDQVYWTLTFGETRHYDPVSLRLEMANYTIFVDGISKAFAATGVRVGWAVAPPDVAARMSPYLGHVGAWAPKAEQIAAAALLNAPDAIAAYHARMLPAVQERLNLLHNGLLALREEGYPVNALEPMGAIYLTARLALLGRHTPEGRHLKSDEDIRTYLLNEAALAIVPFEAFGATVSEGWFRLSVGAVGPDEIRSMLPRLKAALDKLA